MAHAHGSIQAARSAPSFARLYLLVLILLGGLVLVATLYRGAAGARRELALGLPQLALLLGLAASAHLVLRNLLLFQWRGQRVALAPDEVLVFLALVALPPFYVVLFALPAMAWYQRTSRRGVERGLANLAVLTVASGAAAGSFILLLGVGAPTALAALAAISAYTVTTNMLVAGVFALRENVPVLDVYGERFWIPTLLHIALGAGAGLCLVALWSYHPVAVVAIVPFAYLAREHVQLVARTDREVLVHRRLGEVATALAGEADLDTAASRVLATCRDLFQTGRVALVLEGRTGLPGRAWTREDEGGPPPAARAMAELLPGSVRGALTIHPSRFATRAYTDVDRDLLRIVAGEAAAALANARALEALDESRRELESQRVARPLVKRIVRNLLNQTGADRRVLQRLGESLAREADAADLAGILAAYESMGLGRLKLVENAGQRYVFEGDDLFERSTGQRTTTCDLALGFLCGALQRVGAGEAALGTEVACVSRGEEKCRFAVHAR